MTPKLKTIVLSVIVLMLSACGFHLRGNSQIPDRFNPLYLEVGELNQSQIMLIKKSLKAASAQLVDSPDQATRLFITMGSVERQKIVSSSVSGVELVRLELSLQYRIKNVDDIWIVDNKKITHNTELELDSSNVLSHDPLIAKSTQDLQQSLVRTLIYQLNHL